MNALTRELHERLPSCPCLAVDCLNVLPFSERMEAYANFDAAMSAWKLARLGLRQNSWQARLDYRQALRAWGRYKRAVRAAQSMRNAA